MSGIKQLIFICTLSLLLLSCSHRITKYNRSYAYNRISDHDWSGSHGGNLYTLTLNKGEDIWFDGFLTINRIDTFLLHGFVKGNHYPAGYSLVSDSTRKGRVAIFYCRDSVILKNQDKGMLDTTIVLYKGFKRRRVK